MFAPDLNSLMNAQPRMDDQSVEFPVDAGVRSELEHATAPHAARRRGSGSSGLVRGVLNKVAQGLDVPLEIAERFVVWTRRSLHARALSR